MKSFLVLIFLMMTRTVVAQKSSLADMLWEEFGGRIDVSEDHGGQYEITDDAANGYLKVAFTEDGCGCYSETTVGAYKDSTGDYTTLKMYWDGCGWRKIIFLNQDLIKVLPEDFGLMTFIPSSGENNGGLNAMLYLETRIPKRETAHQNRPRVCALWLTL